MKGMRVRQLDIPPGRRVLAISDIHSSRDFLLTLLERAGFCQNDVLVLLGDFVEKRTGGLETLRAIMQLSRQDNVVPVLGNCDDIAVNFADGNPNIEPGFYDWYFREWGEKCLLVEMGNAVGVHLRGREDYPALRQAVNTYFAPEIAFLRSLPHAVVSQRYLFVHGGVPREEHLEEIEGWRCMKNDDFLSQGYRFRRWCVVGHWPVTLYDPVIPSARPLVEWQRHIISIDGGCSLSWDGQLNVLILPGDGSEDFSYLSWDGLPQVTALDPQAPSASSINIRHAHNRVELLQEGGEFCRCRHLESGRELDILTGYLYREKDGQLCCKGATNYRLPVFPGERLSVVCATSRGLLAKKDGITGWYSGRTAPIPSQPVHCPATPLRQTTKGHKKG